MNQLIEEDIAQDGGIAVADRDGGLAIVVAFSLVRHFEERSGLFRAASEAESIDIRKDFAGHAWPRPVLKDEKLREDYDSSCKVVKGFGQGRFDRNR